MVCVHSEYPNMYTCIHFSNNAFTSTLPFTNVSSWSFLPFPDSQVYVGTLGLLHGCQGPKYLNYYLLPPSVHVNWKLELETKPGLKLGYSDIE